MAIPFRDLRNEDSWGLAGFLRFIMTPDGREMHGALFLINSRGEPVDFAFSRIDIQAAFLWREGEARRSAVVRLTAALFEACPKNPSLLFALADEVHPKLFTEDILVDLPVCRVSDGLDPARGPSDSVEALTGSIHLFWSGTPPEEDSSERRLLEALLARQLVTEPFERAAIGIGEALREQ